MWAEHKPMLTVRGLHKAFGDHEVLTGIDLDVSRGEVLGVIGPNGVGKSTMASIIAGNIPLDSGELALEGEQWDPQRVMLIDPQHELDPQLSVAQAMFRQREEEVSDEEALAAARRILAETGVPLMPTDRLGELSNAERRMAEVVRMLADPRDLIVIDELSNALNAREVEDLRYALERTAEDKRAVIYITHRLEEALRLCHRIVVLRDGRVEATFSSLTATTEQLTEAMFGEVIDTAPRRVNATEDVVMDVVGLECSTGAVSFRLRAGEVVGLCGARDSGVDEVRDALIGKRPAPMASLTVAGTPAIIEAPRDLPRLKIAVLTSVLDPESESHSARNLTMLDGDEGDATDEAIEDTTKILLALRESEMAMSRLLNRPMQSTGQRRWQQMQDVAAQHAHVMILIEPLEALDVAARERFMRLLEDVTGRGAGVLLFSGDEGDLHELSDRLLVMANSTLQEWKPSEVTVEDLRSVSRASGSSDEPSGQKRTPAREREPDPEQIVDGEESQEEDQSAEREESEQIGSELSPEESRPEATAEVPVQPQGSPSSTSQQKQAPPAPVTHARVSPTSPPPQPKALTPAPQQRAIPASPEDVSSRPPSRDAPSTTESSSVTGQDVADQSEPPMKENLPS